MVGKQPSRDLEEGWVVRGYFVGPRRRANDNIKEHDGRACHAQDLHGFSAPVIGSSAVRMAAASGVIGSTAVCG